MQNFNRISKIVHLPFARHQSFKNKGRFYFADRIMYASCTLVPFFDGFSAIAMWRPFLDCIHSVNAPPSQFKTRRIDLDRLLDLQSYRDTHRE